MSLLVRTGAADPLSVVSGVRAAVIDTDPNVPVFAATTLEDHLPATLAQERLSATLAAIFRCAVATTRQRRAVQRAVLHRCSSQWRWWRATSPRGARRGLIPSSPCGASDLVGTAPAKISPGWASSRRSRRRSGALSDHF